MRRGDGGSAAAAAQPGAQAFRVELLTVAALLFAAAVAVNSVPPGGYHGSTGNGIPVRFHGGDDRDKASWRNLLIKCDADRLAGSPVGACHPFYKTWQMTLRLSAILSFVSLVAFHLVGPPTRRWLNMIESVMLRTSAGLLMFNFSLSSLIGNGQLQMFPRTLLGIDLIGSGVAILGIFICALLMIGPWRVWVRVWGREAAPVGEGRGKTN